MTSACACRGHLPDNSMYGHATTATALSPDPFSLGHARARMHADEHRRWERFRTHAPSYRQLVVLPVARQLALMRAAFVPLARHLPLWRTRANVYYRLGAFVRTHLLNVWYNRIHQCVDVEVQAVDRRFDPLASSAAECALPRAPPPPLFAPWLMPLPPMEGGGATTTPAEEHVAAAAAAADDDACSVDNRARVLRDVRWIPAAQAGERLREILADTVGAAARMSGSDAIAVAAGLERIDRRIGSLLRAEREQFVRQVERTLRTLLPCVLVAHVVRYV